MGLSGQEYWSGLSFPTSGDLPDPGIKPSPLASPALAGRFFTTSTTWEAQSPTYSATIQQAEQAPLPSWKFQRQGHVSPLPFEILAKTFLADRGSAHEEASSGSVLDITGCLPGSAPQGAFLSW